MYSENKKWQLIRNLLKRGLKATEIARKLKTVTPAQIYRKKKQWEKEDYYKEKKYAVYHTPEYKAWRLAVFTRDKFQCRHCKATKRLQADHIIPRSVRPDLAYDVANGRTLCYSCHKKTPTFGYKATNYKGKL